MKYCELKWKKHFIERHSKLIILAFYPFLYLTFRWAQLICELKLRFSLPQSVRSEGSGVTYGDNQHRPSIKLEEGTK